jgi:hypothetical protein
VECESGFFRQAAFKPLTAGKGKSTKPTGWGRIFATLIRHGHDKDGLMRYTARQIGLFYKEALRAEAQAQAGAIIAVNLGMAGGKEATKAVKNLTA